MRVPGLCVVVVIISACGQPPEPGPTVDAGEVDAGAVDAGTKPDAGAMIDAGQQPDTGQHLDAGAVDAGVMLNDSAFVAQTIPGSVAAGATFTVSVTMR